MQRNVGDQCVHYIPLTPAHQDSTPIGPLVLRRQSLAAATRSLLPAGDAPHVHILVQMVIVPPCPSVWPAGSRKL
jgi:hypothetical protein